MDCSKEVLVGAVRYLAHSSWRQEILQTPSIRFGNFDVTFFDEVFQENVGQAKRETCLLGNLPLGDDRAPPYLIDNFKFLFFNHSFRL